MKWKSAIGFVVLALGLGGSCLAAEGQKTVVIHAGQLFDGESDRLASRQVIVIQGERIADVGSEGSVKIPAGAEEIDLGTATVLPGLIESHNHMFKVGNYPGRGSDAAVPAEIRPGTPFSAPYITILASINARFIPFSCAAQLKPPLPTTTPERRPHENQAFSPTSPTGCDFYDF